MGKTTTAINLGTALAAIGEDVLIVDLDPQGNASTGLGIGHKQRIHSTYEVLVGDCDLAARRSSRRLFPVSRIAPVDPGPSSVSSWRLRAMIVTELSSSRRRSRRLASQLDGFECTYVLVDCPPSLNLLTINAMTAADAVLVPLQCEFFALEGLSQLLQTRGAGQATPSIRG